jgi:hypothetical protein
MQRWRSSEFLLRMRRSVSGSWRGRSRRGGIAAGTNATIRELGGVFGVALVGWAFASPTAYTQPRAFANGYDHALWACVIFTAVGAITASAAIRPLGPRARSTVRVGDHAMA